MPIDKMKKSLLEKLKGFWEKYEKRIIILLGFVLACGLSFEAGILKARNISQKPLVVEIPSGNVAGTSTQNSFSSNIPDESLKEVLKKNIADSISNMPQKCAFVGSKNSNLYHLPTSSYAKRIKPENLICFSSKDDAQSKGYQPDKSLSK